MNAEARPFRLLVVDDTPSIHEDIRSILKPPVSAGLDGLEEALFGASVPEVPRSAFEIDSAYQGQEALDCVRASVREDQPYALAIVDVRMPPGWDGVDTVARLWEEDREIQVVLCTAYSDYSWANIMAKLGNCDNLLVLKKPFDAIEILQVAHALSEKWRLRRQVQQQLRELDRLVQERTRELEQAYEDLKHEMAEKDRLEVELRLSQKLDAIGQLAAGIAHEINTPVQYIGDSVHFLQDAFDSLQALLERYRGICRSGQDREEASKMAQEAEDGTDLVYLEREIPGAIGSIFDGAKRVSSIVQALTELTYPGQREWCQADLNKALFNALMVARSEYKDVADLEMDLGDIPLVRCQIGEMNQVFLNLILNASHAVADMAGHSGGKGLIRVQTLCEGDQVQVAIADTGPGIPEAIRERIFDPFFTTRDVGHGMGQGLSIARAIVDRHKGRLSFESSAGGGTIFTVQLPVGEE